MVVVIHLACILHPCSVYNRCQVKIIVSKTKFDQLLFIIEWNLNDSDVRNVQPEFTYAVSTQTIYICKHTDLITYFEFMSEK